ncbi:MAG: FecR domain-containing protein [Spirochaetia bacterium]|jgi:hypothetical protein|nr:FecR domain-containing protein [Spirochaetia bacterium]
MKRLTILVALAITISIPTFADVTAVSVKGTVGAIVAKKMQPISAGMTLPDDATIVTGANSEVTLSVNNGVLTLKSLTTAKLSGVSVTPSSSKAALALRSGTVVSEVKQIQGLKTSFTITTPVGTSSVRGTSHTVSYSTERGMGVVVTSGLVAVSSGRGGTRPVAAGSQYSQDIGAAPPMVTTQTAQAAQEAARPATVFAPPEETALAVASGETPSSVDELVNLVPATQATGLVNVHILFP